MEKAGFTLTRYACYATIFTLGKQSEKRSDEKSRLYESFTENSHKAPMQEPVLRGISSRQTKMASERFG